MEPNFSPDSLEKTRQEATRLRSTTIGGIIEKTTAVISQEGASENLQKIIGKDFDFGKGKNIGQTLKTALEDASPSEIKMIDNQLGQYLKSKRKVGII